MCDNTESSAKAQLVTKSRGSRSFETLESPFLHEELLSRGGSLHPDASSERSEAASDAENAQLARAAWPQYQLDEALDEPVYESVDEAFEADTAAEETWDGEGEEAWAPEDEENARAVWDAGALEHQAAEDAEDPYRPMPEFDTPTPSRRTTTAPPPSVDFATAKNVMWEVIRILNRQHDEKAADPDRSSAKASWFITHKDLLREWYQIVYGKPEGSKRTRPTGDALAAKLEAAMVKTRPLLAVLEARGGEQWKKQLADFVYGHIADLEYEAVTTKPKPAPPKQIERVHFPTRPTPVSLEQFFSHVATWESRPIDINMGVGRYSAGSYTTGAVFTASQQDQRVLLWTNGLHVLFLRDGTIWAQDGLAFSQDIIMGAFIVAAQNAAGSAFLAKLMVEVALSFTPWGLLADGVFALEALTRGDWKGAALTFLPGPSISLASKTKTARVAGRGLAAAGTITAQVVKGAIRFMGRGAYRLKGKLLRGFWIVGESGGVKSFRFFDDAGKRWVDVPDAHLYIKCSKCDFTPRGRGEAFEGAVDEIMQALASSTAYSSRGRALISRQLVKDVVDAYGPFGDHVVDLITDAWMTAANRVKFAEDTLRVAKSLSVIRDARGYQQAIEIFADLASSSAHAAPGTLFELRWAAVHAKDIKELALPIARRNGWYGKGLDVLKKNGDAIELKNFNFTSAFYKSATGLTVKRIMKQVKSRLHYPDVKRVIVIFSSDAGIMPAALRKQLTAAMADLSKTSGKPCTFGFWSPGASAGLAG